LALTGGWIKAADEFKDKTKAPNELWQTDYGLHLSEGYRPFAV